MPDMKPVIFPAFSVLPRQGLVGKCASMKHGMRLGDYLDMEWLLEEDRADDSSVLQARDRQWGLEADGLGLSAEKWPLFWVERRRAMEKKRLPSELWAAFLTLARWALAICGVIGGVSLVRGLLQYFGAQPVNVSVFLLLAVFSQTALSFLSILFCLIRRPERGYGASLGRTLFSFFAQKSGWQESTAVRFTRSVLAQRRYARLLGWEILSVMQVGGLCFALGALACTLGSVIVTDLAFGWQSTLQAGPEGVHALVTELSFPWSWLPDSLGLVPTLSQIEGSRIVLKDGISGLASADLAAWWPFLCACLTVYAVLPRAIFLFVARRKVRVLEAAFVHPDARRVADRMRTPHVRTERPTEERFTALPAPQTRAVPPAPAPVSELDAVLVAGPEILERVAPDDLDALLRQTLGRVPDKIMAASLEEEQIQSVLEECALAAWQGEHERFVVLVEAWQPPIQENLAALSLLGRDEAMNRSLTLLLVGRPQKGNWLTAPTPTELRIWTEAVGRLAPLRMDVIGVSA